MDIYVGNLSFDATDEELQTLFEEYGAISSASVIKDKFSGKSRGFGFVEMEDKTEAESAISGLNEYSFMGRTLRVNEARPKKKDKQN